MKSKKSRNKKVNNLSFILFIKSIAQIKLWYYGRREGAARKDSCPQAYRSKNRRLAQIKGNFY